MTHDRDAFRAWPAGAGPERSPIHTGAQGLWIREFGLRPSAGVNVDPSVLRPFSLAGLGLTRLGRRRTPTRPLPVASRLAIDITDPHALSITYLEHTDDAETPLAHAQFADEHPVAWIAAVTRQQHILLTVSDHGPALDSPGPVTAIHALGGAWAGIIACNADCVRRSSGSAAADCARHRLTDKQQRRTGLDQ
ncbi:hypothetical protein [Williamsia soli]|uniref:hypothetical protein n=1 Tax=Williamsia soli TaxID=364929 RepID=UPI001A9DFFA1|nr:hypothetical protein [Williamsia soli]